MMRIHWSALGAVALAMLAIGMSVFRNTVVLDNPAPPLEPACAVLHVEPGQ